MPQKIFEDFLSLIKEFGKAAPEFMGKYAELTELNGHLSAKDEISADELAELKAVCSSVIDMSDALAAEAKFYASGQKDEALFPDGPRDLSEIMPYVKALKDPMACYLKNLTEGKSPAEAAADTSWLENYIGSPEAVKEDPTYNPESFKREGMSFAQAVEIYKAEAAYAKKGFDSHVARLSKDTDQPHETFDAKMRVVTSLVTSYKGEKGFPRFSVMARDAYQRMDTAVNPEKATTLNIVRGQVLCNSFYSITTDKLYDYTVSMGEIDDMATVDEATRQRFHSIAKKVRLKPNNLGVNAKNIDVLNKTSLPLGVFQNYYDSIVMNEPNAPNDPEDPLYPVLTELKKQADNILGCLHDDPDAKPPTAEDLKPLVDLIADYVDDQAVIDGNLMFKLDMLYLDSTVQDIALQYPEFKEASDKITKSIQDEGLRTYDFLVGKLAEDPDPAQYNDLNAGIRNLYMNGFATREHHENMRFYRMAANPRFCDDEIARARNALAEMAKYGTASNTYDFNRDSTTYDLRTIPVDDKTVYKEVYKTILFGEIVKAQAGNPVKSLEEYETRFRDFDQVGIVKPIYDLNAKDFLMLANDEQKLKTAVDLIQKKENTFLDLVDESSLKALTEKSRPFGLSNSDMYNRIKDSIELIQRKDKGIQGGSLEEYHELINNCSEYLLNRSSDANTPTGKKRFAAAAKILRTVGPQLALKLTEADAEQIHKDMVTNMFRSKTFRNMCIADAKERIANAFGGAEFISEANYERLSAEQKTALGQDYQILRSASQVTDAMKRLKKDQIMTGRITKEEDLTRLTSCVDELVDDLSAMNDFYDNPANALGNIIGRKAPEAKAEEVQLGK